MSLKMQYYVDMSSNVITGYAVVRGTTPGSSRVFNYYKDLRTASAVVEMLNALRDKEQTE